MILPVKRSVCLIKRCKHQRDEGILNGLALTESIRGRRKTYFLFNCVDNTLYL